MISCPKWWRKANMRRVLPGLLLLFVGTWAGCATAAGPDWLPLLPPAQHQVMDWRVNFGSQAPFSKHVTVLPGAWMAVNGSMPASLGINARRWLFHEASAGRIERTPERARQVLSGCGDAICQKPEDSASCPRDCRRLAPASAAARIADRSLAPRGVKLPDGRVLIGLKRTLADRHVIQALTTSPRDDEWIIRGTVEENASADGGDLGNPIPFRHGQGRLLMAFRDHQSRPGGERTYQLRVEFSDDDGLTWHRGKAEGEGIIDVSSHGLWEPFLYEDAHGDLRVVYAKEHAPRSCRGKLLRKQDIVTKVSRDGGKSWAGEAVVASAGFSRDGVPSVARLRDGSFVLVFESWRNEACDSLNPKLVIRSMQSRDGVTWDRRRTVYSPGARHEDGAAASFEDAVATWPYALRLRDGRLLVLFTTDEDHVSAREPRVARDRDFDIKFLLTKHEATYESLEWEESGAQLAYAMTAGDDEVRYASAVQLDDGNVLLLFARPARHGVLRLR
jgi:hypothetical protein